jgi:hypothetical protein
MQTTHCFLLVVNANFLTIWNRLEVINVFSSVITAIFDFSREGRFRINITYPVDLPTSSLSRCFVVSFLPSSIEKFYSFSYAAVQFDWVKSLGVIFGRNLSLHGYNYQIFLLPHACLVEKTTFNILRIVIHSIFAEI